MQLSGTLGYRWPSSKPALSSFQRPDRDAGCSFQRDLAQAVVALQNWNNQYETPAAAALDIHS
jgi:hypothetical protein